MPNEKSRLVYSSDQKTPRQDKFAEKALPADVRHAQQKVIVRVDRKSRGGKSVTVVEGLLMPQREMVALLKQCKDRLGTGGTVKDTALEIQGDHRDALMEALEKMGYRPKRSGGR